MFANFAKIAVPALLVITAATQAQAGGFHCRYTGATYGFNGESFVISALNDLDIAANSISPVQREIRLEHAILNLKSARLRFCSAAARTKLRIAIDNLLLICNVYSQRELEFSAQCALTALKLERIEGCGAQLHARPVFRPVHHHVHRPVVIQHGYGFRGIAPCH